MRGWATIISALAMLAGAGAAEAHPHVWIKVRSEVLFAPDGMVTGVRHAWSFDEMYTSYALQGLESKQKGVYTREDLAPLAQTNIESLKEFKYFTFARLAGKKERFAEPIDYALDHKDGALVLTFTLPLKAPLKPTELLLEVYDPSFFIDFSFEDADPVKLVAAPAACKSALQRPNDGTANAVRMGEDNFASGDTSNYGAMYANKITVSCP